MTRKIIKAPQSTVIPQKNLSENEAAGFFTTKNIFFHTSAEHK
jgi:hypothetical protein